MTLLMPQTRFDSMRQENEVVLPIIYSSTTSNQGNINRFRSRIIEQTFNNRKYFYRNRVDFLQYQILITTLQKSHRYQQQKQINTTQELKRNLKTIQTDQNIPSLATELCQTKSAYRFGVRTATSALNSSAKLLTNTQQKLNTNEYANQPKILSSVAVQKSRSNEIINLNQNTQEPSIEVVLDPVELRREMTLNDELSNKSSIKYRVQMKTFALEDESQRNSRYTSSMIEKKNQAFQNDNSKETVTNSVIDMKQVFNKPQRSSIKRKSKSIFPDDLIEEYKRKDRIFAEHYRQFQIGKRFHEVPNYNLDHHQQHVSIVSLQKERKLLKRKLEDQHIELNLPQLSFINQKDIKQRMKNVLQTLEQFKRTS